MIAVLRWSVRMLTSSGHWRFTGGGGAKVREGVGRVQVGHSAGSTRATTSLRKVEGGKVGRRGQVQERGDVQGRREVQKKRWRRLGIVYHMCYTCRRGLAMGHEYKGSVVS